MINRACYNYEHKDEWWSSDKAYDEWFFEHYNQYNDFIVAVKRELIIDLEYAKVNLNDEDLRGKRLLKKGRQRTIYTIRYEALTRIEMKKNRESRVYYSTLEKTLFSFANHQQMKLQASLTVAEESIKDLQEQVVLLSKKNPASLYRIWNQKTHQLLYIGKDQSLKQGRAHSHMLIRGQILKQKHQLIDVVLATIPY